MINRVKFNDIKVGETYFVQSRYWHKVLGVAEIAEVSRCESDPNRGEVTAICNWAKSLYSDGTVYLDSDWDWFWDARPNEDEQRALVKEVLGF